MWRHGDIGSDGQQTGTLMPLTQLLLPSALSTFCGFRGWQGSSNDHPCYQATNSSSAANTFPLNIPWVWGSGGDTEGQVRVQLLHFWYEYSSQGKAWKFRELREPFREITVMGRWSWPCSLWLATGHQAQVLRSLDGPYLRGRKVVTVPSGNSVLLSWHVPLSSNLMYSWHCCVFGFLRLSVTASGVLMFDLQCSNSLRCGVFPN